ncbi:MAG: MerR family DNA-binding transcriptional regulator [Defluviitaleaceae bacterium]|nr:MerR family DNA-binding transcriptional regulator [Defluviitaleaceae bacterium]
MIRKNNLLSIGEVSKLTDTSIKSLRYYDRINVLKPAHIDPDSQYRYYTIDQVRLIGLIQFSIEIGIPLAKITQFVEPDGTTDLRSFLQEGRRVAEKKLEVLEKGLRHIDIIMHQMDLAEKHQIGQIYMKEIPEKKIYAIPCEKNVSVSDQIKILQSISKLPGDERDWEESEFGILHESSPSEVACYYFVDVPKKIDLPDTKTLPGGTYFCIQNESSKIEKAPEIFKEHIGDSFFATEIELHTARHKINEPIRELRVISC